MIRPSHVPPKLNPRPPQNNVKECSVRVLEVRTAPSHADRTEICSTLLHVKSTPSLVATKMVFERLLFHEEGA